MKSVKFGNRGALKIVEPTILETVQKGIETKIGYCINQKRHSLLNHKNLKRLSSKPHQVGVNTLGQRFLLLLTTIQLDDQSKRYSIFINRKTGMMIVVRFRFSADLFSCTEDSDFTGTLFEGELVRIEKDANGGTDWFYLISDILIERGELVISKPLSERLSKISGIIEDNHVPDLKQDPCNIQVKKYFEYQYIQSIIDDYVPTLPYKDAVTGLAFKNSKKDILYILPEFRSQPQKDEKKPVSNKKKNSIKKITISKSSIEKLKPTPSDSNGNFKLVETDMPDVFELYNKSNERVGYAAVPDLETSTLINELLEDVENTNDNLYVKCIYSEKFSKWVPVERIASL